MQSQNHFAFISVLIEVLSLTTSKSNVLSHLVFQNATTLIIQISGETNTVQKYRRDVFFDGIR